MDSQRTGLRLVEVDTADALQDELAAAGLAGGWPVLVVVGGAAGLSGAAEAVARRVVEEVAVPVALDRGAAIVNGGTDSGVMRIVGRAHAGQPGRPPLVGVASIPTTGTCCAATRSSRGCWERVGLTRPKDGVAGAWLTARVSMTP